ncbi:MAG: hypothetical protein K2N51_20870 [Lachnospiraceae bacterium]|nr:hypothetical protein [Lachnospiraceae bacterium]
MNTEKLDKTIEVIEDYIIEGEKGPGMIKADMITALAELIKARMVVELGELGLKIKELS